MKKLIALVFFFSLMAVAAENFDDVVSITSSAGGTAVVTSNPNRASLCVQNTEVTIAYCSKGVNVPTSSVYGYSLAPASSSGGADGGARCFSGLSATYVHTCLSASGTGKIARSTAGR